MIDELGRVDLWRVNLRPGKPLAYGQVGGVPFFACRATGVRSCPFELFVARRCCAWPVGIGCRRDDDGLDR